MAKTTFERGKIARAKRDVLARKLEKYEDHIEEPYALATFIVKKGAKVKGKKAKKKTLTRKKKYWK